jgi:hypothetical protein
LHRPPLAALLVCVALALPAAAQQSFVVDDTVPVSGAPGLPAGTWDWSVSGVTASGLVVGSAWGTYSRTPFVWGAAGATPLGVPPGFIAAQPAGVNSLGWIAGTSYTEAGTGTPTLWKNGTVTAIPVPGQTDSQVTAIGGAGQVAGITGLNQPGVVRGFVWNNGSFTNLPSLGLGGNGQAFPAAVNAAGVVVGYSEVSAGRLTATQWVNDTPTNLGVAGDFSKAADANESGMVVGFNNTQGFVMRNGEIQYLSRPGAVGVHAVAVNDSGDVVGTIFYQDPTNRTEAFLYHGGQWLQGSQLFTAPGITATAGLDVTDDGHVFVIGYGSGDRQTVFELFPSDSPRTSGGGDGGIADPTAGAPEPATAVLLGIAGLGAAGWRRLRQPAPVVDQFSTGSDSGLPPGSGPGGRSSTSW